ncbi:uncharacterized protein LOC141819454 [Curcuma longa]|uniref:uncharacterized protein LOC141819454 n=1 Tax=Curcuma longa TaxID=136217 RepID=UPI003D9EE2F1
MALFALFFWFLVANSLILLVGFVARHVSRTRTKGTTPEEKLLEFSNHDSSPEKEEPRLSFKFQYQIPDQQKGKSNAEALLKNEILVEEKPKHYEPDTFNELVRDNVADVSEECSGFDSESDSISVSDDGYSVHDLAVDSDAFSSEKNFEADELKSAEKITYPCSGGGIESVIVAKSQGMHLKYTDSSSEEDDNDDVYLMSHDEALALDNKYSPRKEADDSTSSRPLLDPPINAYLRSIAEMDVVQKRGQDEQESPWEHQDLIEQLRMELQKLKDIGLPTILEESESPITVEDSKPLMVDESFLHDDAMVEIRKSYWSYRERMRKFDILNYQKMYTIGFLQLKDPLQSVESGTLGLTFQSIFPRSFWSVRRKSNANPLEKLIEELQSDLEMVYVGQTCLSWEFLRWQYEKAKEMPQLFHPFGNHCYNQAAGEFQQFQVIIQRFTENEAFQGPRLPNYIENRRLLHNLLLVPVLKEDCLKDKMEDEQGISGKQMEEIMEESIRIFWEFVKADKDATPGILKGFMGTHVELQGPSDFDLLEDIQTDLYKKEKKLKDILRTGNCLIKKLKKPKEGRPNQDLLFSQVDLKLVARVLRMSRITSEQLLWCRKKLSKIKFVERKVIREPSSFLLFPC